MLKFIALIIAEFIEPEDFKDNPYIAGLNQLGHVVTGAAVVAIATLVVATIFQALLLAAMVFVAWELYQLERRGGNFKDYVADLVYWSMGATIWAILVNHDWISGPAIMFPMLPLLAWVVEYLRLRR